MTLPSVKTTYAERRSPDGENIQAPRNPGELEEPAPVYIGLLSEVALLVVSDDRFSITWRPGFKDPAFICSREAGCNVIGKLCSNLASA